MNEMTFKTFGDVGVFFLTLPGLILNFLKSLAMTGWGLLQAIYGLALALLQLVVELPVVCYKLSHLVVTKIWSLLVGVWHYVTLSDWNWNSLNNFPALPGKLRTEFIAGGINQPTDNFASGYSTVMREGVQPLREAMNQLRDVIDFLPWPVFFLIILLGVWFISRKLWVVVLGAVALCYIGMFSLMALASQTISLMVISIFICCAAGIPIGIAMSRSDAVEASLKPVLDIMQTMPSFVYLIPVLIFFGVSPVAGLIAVCIYAIVPVIRLTNLGIRLVPFDVIEASHAFGSTYLQRLFGVLLPLALPNVFAGINQTIMMALAMVVIAALVGAPGLGQEVLSGTNNANLARGLLPGMAIALIAIVIDRSLHFYGERLQEHRKVGH